MLARVCISLYCDSVTSWAWPVWVEQVRGLYIAAVNFSDNKTSAIYSESCVVLAICNLLCEMSCGGIQSCISSVVYYHFQVHAARLSAPSTRFPDSLHRSLYIHKLIFVMALSHNLLFYFLLWFSCSNVFTLANHNLKASRCSPPPGYLPLACKVVRRISTSSEPLLPDELGSVTEPKHFSVIVYGMQLWGT